MQLITPVSIAKSPNPISYASEILSLGSCFAENISEKLEYFKFRNVVNPFGILFSPDAIEKFIAYAVSGKVFSEADVFFHNERWHCFDAHSDLSDPDRQRLIADLNHRISSAREKMATATHFIITPGTAWVYRKIDTDALVANCHKVPQREFSKEWLSPDAVCASVRSIIDRILELNPTARIIFTISPVRHLKDGIIQNQMSKSNLISGLHQALQGMPNCHYFPSFEIVMDELRDYRFYASDMMHPNQLAIDYIWEKFVAAWISASEYETMQEVDGIRKALAHRPFNPDSEQHRKFLESLEKRIGQIREKLPLASFT